MIFNNNTPENIVDKDSKGLPITRRQALIGLGVLGLSTIFGFGGIALNVKEAFAASTTVTRKGSSVPDFSTFKDHNRVIRFSEDHLFSHDPEELKTMGDYNLDVYGWDDPDVPLSYSYLFKWVFKKNFVMLGQKSPTRKVSGWCLQRIAPTDVIPSNLNNINGAVCASDNYLEIAPTLGLCRTAAMRDVFGNVFDVEITFTVVDLVTSGGYSNLKDSCHNGQNFIPVACWRTQKKNAKGKWVDIDPGRLALLADGRPGKAAEPQYGYNSVTGLIVAIGLEFYPNPEYEHFGPPLVEDGVLGSYSAYPEGDIYFSWSDFDIANQYSSGSASTPYGRMEPYEESIGFMASDTLIPYGLVTPCTNIWAPDTSHSKLTIARNYPESELRSLFRRASDEVWDALCLVLLGNQMTARVYGSAGEVDGPLGAFLSKTPFKNYDKSGNLRSQFPNYGMELIWTGSGCTSNINFETVSKVWVDVRIVRGTGTGEARWPGGGWTTEPTTQYSRRHYVKDESPEYEFEADTGSRIQYVRVVSQNDYKAAHAAGTKVPWEELSLSDFMERSHTFSKIKECWKIVVKFQRNLGKLEIYKHDAEMGDHTAQGDGVLGGDAAFAAGHVNNGATFRVWRVDGSSFIWGSNTVSSATVKVPANSPNSPAVFDDIEIGDYYWSEVTAPDGYRAPATAQHRVTITPFDTDGDEVVVTETNAIKKGTLNIRKVDADTGRETPQGDARFTGATFAVKNVSAQPIMYGGKKIAVGAIVGNAVIESGNVATMRNLPYGRYEITEVAASGLVGYDWTPTNAAGKVVEIRDDNTTVTLAEVIRDPVWRGGVAIQKVDSDQIIAVDTNKHHIDLEWDSAQGNAELAGAEFKIFSISDSYVHVGGHTYEPRYHAASDIKNPATAADCLVTLITDEYGRARTDNTVLPYGTYVMFETKAPAGYHKNEAFEEGVVFKIREKGGMVLMQGNTGWIV